MFFIPDFELNNMLRGFCSAVIEMKIGYRPLIFLVPSQWNEVLSCVSDFVYFFI